MREREEGFVKKISNQNRHYLATPMMVAPPLAMVTSGGSPSPIYFARSKCYPKENKTFPSGNALDFLSRFRFSTLSPRWVETAITAVG